MAIGSAFKHKSPLGFLGGIAVRKSIECPQFGHCGLGNIII